ncbi:nuclease-related domain-containing protein [Arthrobacter crystallopoietes]|uniref:nuclease-related domain-containing protein n=1 Tax=Crystallibacter crystallopoietes TaxID=37928 RepID=UPI003D1FFA68
MANGMFGTASAWLGNATWTKNRDVAEIGAIGERRTAQILDSFSDRAAVLHDLSIPIKGISANIDHVVVSGRKVLILESKVWAPGIYWTLGGTNRWGLTRVVHTEKRTREMARSSLVRFLVTMSTLFGPGTTAILGPTPCGLGYCSLHAKPACRTPGLPVHCVALTAGYGHWTLSYFARTIGVKGIASVRDMLHTWP